MRHLQKSGIITLKALGGPIGSRTAQVQEAYEVHYSDGIRAAKKFSNERQAIEFAKDLIKSKKGLQFVDVFNAGSGFHSTADTDAIVAWWGDGSYTSNKSKHDSKLASKKIKEEVIKEANTVIKTKDGKLHNYPNFKKNDVIKFLAKKGMKHVSDEKDLKSNNDFYIVESINEGKKRFYQQDGIGSSKYTISFHDGKEKHKDGSDFFGIKIFKNKPDLENFKKELVKKGYREDSGYKKESIENVANGLPQTMGKEKSLKREALKSIVKEVMQEEAEYQKFFQKVMDKAGKSIPSMSDDEKKAFFNKVDAAWKAKQERD